jgi:hypothetical protein
MALKVGPIQRHKEQVMHKFELSIAAMVITIVLITALTVDQLGAELFLNLPL